MQERDEFIADFGPVMNFEEHKLYFELKPGEISEIKSKYLFFSKFQVEKNPAKIKLFKIPP